MAPLDDILLPLKRKIIYYKELDARSCAYQLERMPRQSIVDGLFMPCLIPGAGQDFAFGPETVRQVRRMHFRDDDVLVLTFPKSGTTWCQHIVFQMLREHPSEKLYLDSPMLEFFGADYANEQLPSPRVLKTHLTPNLFHHAIENKVVFCARNPKDVCVSYFHHTVNMAANKCPDLQFDVFFEHFIAGRFEYGDYFQHLRECLKHVGDDNWLLLRYEDMLEDLPSAVLRIARFLGPEYAAKYPDAESVGAIVQNSTFSSMKTKSANFLPDRIFIRGNHHIRNGKSKNWQQYLSKEQSDLVDRTFKQKLGGTLAERWWTDEMQWDSA